MRGVKRKLISVTDDFVYALIRGDDKGLKVSNLRVVYRYLVPPRDKLDRGYVDLRPMTAVGFMGMGKTVFFTRVTGMLKEKIQKIHGEEPLAVMGKSIVDVVEYINDNKDLVRDRKIVVLFLDDILYQGLSTERNKARDLADKYYSDIRHKPEKLGFKSGILYVFIAGQRWKLIPGFFRNTPIVVFKPLIAVEKYEKEIYIDILDYKKDVVSRALAETMLSILERAAKIYYTTWDDTVKAVTIVRPMWDYPLIYIQNGVEDPDKVFDVKVPFNYSGIYPSDDGVDINKMSKTVKKAVIEKIIEALTRCDPVITIRETMKILREIKIRADNNLIHEIWKQIREKQT